MKRRIGILLCLLLIIVMTGCGKNITANKQVSIRPAGVNDVLEQAMDEAESKKDDNTGQPAESKKDGNTGQPAESTGGVDVDLTLLSSTMVYSEVFNMMVSPEKYIGKTVKMKGLFAVFYDEATDKYYFACIVQDATACCSQGIEFVLTDDYVFPDDYPDADEEICVVGVFDTYQEGDFTYCTLRNAILQ